MLLGAPGLATRSKDATRGACRKHSKENRVLGLIERTRVCSCVSGIPLKQVITALSVSDVVSFFSSNLQSCY